MADESFEQLDESLMKKFKVLREKKTPAEFLKGFSTAVEEKILKRREEKVRQPVWARVWMPILVPALGALVIFVWASLLQEPLKGPTLPSSVTPLPLALGTVNEISNEIAALEELGVWSEEDDTAVGGLES